MYITALNMSFIFVLGSVPRLRRKILTPAFHFGIIKDFVKVFNKETDKMVEILDKLENNIVNVIPILNQFTLSVIAGM